MAEILVEFDATSFGIYPTPYAVVTLPEAVDPEVYARSGYVDENALALRPFAARPTVSVRVVPDDIRNDLGGILQWIDLPRAFAPMVLAEALHGFWFKRFRFSRDFSELRREGWRRVPADVVERRFRQRARHRTELTRHGDSLKAKLWGLAYHRENFRHAHAALRGRTSSNPHFDLLRMNAEFVAHDNLLYSILDEIAAINRTVSEIVTGQSTVASFHQLYDRPSASACLRPVLSTLVWYEDFRARRGATTHAQTVQIAPTPTSDDLHVFHHHGSALADPTPSKFADPVPLGNLFERLCTDSDAAVVALAECILGQFHPYDVVPLRETGTAASPDGSTSAHAWVRRIRFTTGGTPQAQGWAILDEVSGQVAIRATASGTLAVPEIRKT